MYMHACQATARPTLTQTRALAHKHNLADCEPDLADHEPENSCFAGP